MTESLIVIRPSFPSMFGLGAALLAGLLLFAATAAAAEWERVSDK